MRRNITFFVANLPYRSGDEELRFVFEDAGLEVLRSEIVRDRVSGRSRGIGFVEVRTENAGEVIEAVTGKSVRGREIRLEVSNSRKTEGRSEGEVRTLHWRGPEQKESDR